MIYYVIAKHYDPDGNKVPKAIFSINTRMGLSLRDKIPPAATI